MADPSPRLPFPPLSRPPVHLAILLTLAGLVLLLGLGDLGLTDRDEGSNAEAAREMLETGDWISPTLNYEPRYAKPAFVYWLISGTYALFGVHEFAARLPGALFGIGLILLQYFFLARLLGTRVAFFGAVMLLLNVEFVATCRMVLTDPELVFFTTLSSYSFWLGLRGEGRDRQFFWLFYLGMALAMLTKGPVGIVIPLLAVIPYLTLTRQWGKFWRRGFPMAGLVVFLLVAAPWYLAMFAIHGADYAAAAQANTMGRFANPMEGHGGTVLFYFPILFLGFFPWSGFLPFALYDSLKNWRAYRSGVLSPSGENGLALFAGLWVLAMFIFFSLSATRLPHYLFPLFPAASILTAIVWSRFVHEPSPAGLRPSLTTIVILGYLLGLALASLPTVYEAFIDKIALEFPAALKVGPGLTPIIAGATVLVGVMVIRYLGLTENYRASAFWVAGGMTLTVLLILILLALPRFNKYFIAPPQELAEIAGLNLGPDDRLIQFGRKQPSLMFYAKRKIFQINPGEDQKFQPHLDPSHRTMIILQSRLRSRLPSPVSEFPVVLQRYGFSLLSSKPLLR